MQTTEKLCLQWNDFKENVSSAFGKFKDDQEFADVTLACEDGQQVEAHRLVLASSSPFFWNLLKKNKHSHPLIFMRGVKFEDLVAITDFLYLGEANVFQDNLDDFLALAGELKLKGLTSNDKDKEIGEKFVENPKKQRFEKKQVHQKFPKSEDGLEPQFETRVAVADQKVAINVEMEQLDAQINAMINPTDNLDHLKRKLANCNVCGYEAPRSFVVRHIEANHITGVSHSCDICGKTARSRNAISIHMYRKHKTSSNISGQDLL